MIAHKFVVPSVQLHIFICLNCNDKTVCHAVYHIQTEMSDGHLKYLENCLVDSCYLIGQGEMLKCQQ